MTYLHFLKKRIKFGRASQALTLLTCFFNLTMFFIPVRAHAADLSLEIASNGQIKQGTHILGEVYHSWRRDILFAPLNNALINSSNTVRVTAQNLPMDKLNPQLYAVHGANSHIVEYTDTTRVWAVDAPAGSSVTLVADTENGVIDASLFWRLIALFSRLSDSGWLVASLLLPGLLLCAFYINRLRMYRVRSGTTMDSHILAPSPAALTVLFRGFVSRRASAATLVDLARRGHIQLLVRDDMIVLYHKAGRDTLRDHELAMVNRWFKGQKSSRAGSIATELRSELISDQSNSIHLSVYTEVNSYQWFSPHPLITHWQLLSFNLLLTIIVALFFFTVFIFLPNATPLLWFSAGCLTSIAILYLWAPTLTRQSAGGKQAFQALLGARSMLSHKELVHLGMFNEDAWEAWLPLAMVLGVSEAWLSRWQNMAFRQPEWFLTPEPIRDFDQFQAQLKPVLALTSESIRDKILPAYL